MNDDNLKKNQSSYGSSPLLVVVIIVALTALIAATMYFIFTSKDSATCALDTKICPDGTSVGRVGPNCAFAECPVSSSVPESTANWESYVNERAKFRFKFPPNLKVLDIGENTTPIKPDEEFVVSTIGANLFYLNLFIYRSEKDPSNWWASEGKDKFERLADEIGRLYSDPPVTISLTYEETPAVFSGKNALNAVISSDYETPNTPTKRYITIVQHNGYIILLSYRDLGTSTPTIDLSKRILSMFEFF